MDMKKLFLLLVFVYPMLLFAQHDDIYFVPKKEKKVVVSVTKTENLVSLEDEDDCYDDETYYTDDYGYENDDFRYSTRIVRFRNPRSAVSSRLYWDLTYNCGINDWLVYDDGYYLDIYPTYSNTLYYWSRPSYNWWVWDSWYYHGYNWSYNYWGHHHRYLHPSYNWNWNHHYHPHYACNSWRPVHRINKNVPLKGTARVAADNRNVKSGVRKDNAAVSAGRSNSYTPNRQGVQTANRTNKTAVNNKTSVANRNDDLRSSAIPRQQQQRVISNGSVKQNNVRTQQPRRPASVSVVDKKENSKSNNVRTEVNNRRSSNSSSSSKSNVRSTYRSNSSSSSGEYNRPSSTSVSRQRSSSSGGNSSVGNLRSGGTSRSTSGSVRAGSRR